VGGAVTIDGVKVARAEVLVEGSIASQVVDGREDRGGDGDDGLLGSAAGFEAVKQRAEVAVFLPRGRPGDLDESGLEPGGPVAQARRAPLARTLVAGDLPRRELASLRCRCSGFALFGNGFPTQRFLFVSKLSICARSIGCMLCCYFGCSHSHPRRSHRHPVLF
jgi:hypothetical protein